jgi:hypothetical protein
MWSLGFDKKQIGVQIEPYCLLAKEPWQLLILCSLCKMEKIRHTLQGHCEFKTIYVKILYRKSSKKKKLKAMGWRNGSSD